MPYTPDATLVTQPADTGVAASTAAAEFRALKLYIRDVILADLNTKREQSDNTFTSSIVALSSVVISTTCQASNGFNVTASGGFQASGYNGIGLAVSSGMSVGWTSVAATAVQSTSLSTTVVCDEWVGNIQTYPGPASDTRYTFTVNNSKVKVGDVVVATMQTGGAASQFDTPHVHDVQNGSFKIRLYCPPGLGGSGLSSTIGFAVLKRSAL